ncbi:ATP-dependent DNA helicase DinG [Sulfuricystis multivorans]|uniref:ATP-dependent DNA helicase DinG n=1 Tax=Sulfuricystis multivorans TaxID=2211108 RepID=UPI000F826844|nr:ATP-dependent DNA helicase DinG [Sulfuricystis multivorans]
MKTDLKSLTDVMLTEDTKQEIRDKLAAISKAIPGFRSRPAQRVMIAEVAKTLARCPDPGLSVSKPVPGQTILVIQGGTGTGKSLGYGLAGMVMAKRKGKKLVISSSTIALQEQLTIRDLPLFSQAAGLNVSIELAKGRTRYVCQYKLNQAIGDMQQIAMFDHKEERAGATGDVDSDSIRKDIEAMAKDLAEGRWNGDRDLRDAVTDEVWKSITTDRHGCLNRICPFYKSCTQMAARKRLRDASVIVANHDLLLADLAMGGGKILPPPEECFYVIDEAHSLPEKAVSSFASGHFINAERRSAEKLINLATNLQVALGSAYEHTCEQIHDEADRLRSDLTDAYGFLSSLAQLQPSIKCPRPTIEFEDSCLPEEFFEIGENIKSLTNSLSGLLDECQRALNDQLGTDRSKQALFEKLLAEVGFQLGRMEEVHTTWNLFLKEPGENAPPVAKWIEAISFKKNSVDYQINASPVFAGDYLRHLLWEKAAGVVLTSATITTLGTFDDFLRRTGLDSYEVSCVDLPSPFDYATQGLIDIPKMPSPKHYEAHTKAVADRLITDMAKQGPEGMLVLFTSRRQMEDIAGRLPKDLRARVLVQGEQSKAAIISAHCAAIDAGKPSTIFGLASFTEGVDLPSSYCTQVVITKLPFAVPDSPVLRTLARWIERRGGNPFMEISVPDAARKLEQSVGRLIRNETDHGQVVVTDPRLWESRFGRAMLRGLPNFRVKAMGKEVRL